MEKYVRLPNGSKMLIYEVEKTNVCILKFVDTDIDTVKKFLGTEIIDYVDVVDEDGKILRSETANGKSESIFVTTETKTEIIERLVKDEWKEIVESVDEETGETIETEIIHPAKYESIEKKYDIEVIVAPLKHPSVDEEIKDIKDYVGIVNTNNMTLEEFKNYYKNLIGNACSKSIYEGVDVETEYGKEHFSYTEHDQSNIKDLFEIAKLSNFTSPLPYHADNKLCTVYNPMDIVKIYITLCSHKMYQTTYCNILNDMINKANSMEDIKSITYGMDVPKEYKSVVETILKARDELLSSIMLNLPPNVSKLEK